MKRIISYISTLAMGAALLAGCVKTIDEQKFEGEGAVSFNVAFDSEARTRAFVEAPDNVVIRISNANGYTHIFENNDLPSMLWLVSGSYKVEVTGGVAAAPSFTENYTFYGVKEFTVMNRSTQQIDVECRIKTTLVSVDFDGTLAQHLESYSLTLFPVPDSSASPLVFDAANKGAVTYIELAEGQTEIPWTFAADHVRDHEPAILKTGKFEGLEPGKRYNATIAYTYNEKEGTFSFGITVDETTIDTSHEIIIMQKPGFEGLNLEFPVAPIDGQKLNVIAGTDINTLLLSGNIFGEAPGVDVIAADAATLAPYGIECNAIDRGYELVFRTLFFEHAVAAPKTGDGKVTPVTITATDQKDRGNTAYLTAGIGAVNEVARPAIWTKFATVTGFVLDTNTTAEQVKFVYRTVGGVWTDVASTKTDGKFTAKLSGLTAGTVYELDLKIDGELTGAVVTFTTEEATPIIGGGFEDWHQNGRPWYPNPASGPHMWASGNPGSTSLGESYNVVTPSNDVRSGATTGSTKSAYIETKRALIKMAAGSAFYGTYVKTDGTGGEVAMGQPFTSRPTSLKGWYKANPVTVDQKDAQGAPLNKGDMDESFLMVALVDWDAPHHVNTNNQSTFINYDTDPGVIAYGHIVGTTPVTTWTEFEIPLTYRSTTRVPKYIVIMACSSRYGDYFTGGKGSWMYIDDFELVYSENVTTN